MADSPRKSKRSRKPHAPAASASPTSPPPSDPEPVVELEPSSPRERRAFALAAFFIPLAIYSLTLCPTIYWGDGIELTTAAWVLGVPHPTGYPLFCLLGRLAMTIIPFGEPAARLNFLCAVAGAGAVLMMYLLVRRILVGWLTETLSTERSGSMAALGAALIFAFSRNQWFHSVTTEVYTLHIFFVLAMFYVFVRWRQDGRDRDLLWLTALLSLSLTHHTMAIFAAPLVVIAWVHRLAIPKRANQPAALLAEPSPRWPARRLIAFGAALFILPLLLYLYLPIRAAARPPINWGNPVTWDQFFWVVSGGDFRKYYFMHFDPVTPFNATNYPIFFRQRMLGLINVAGDDFLMIFVSAGAAKAVIFLAVSMFTLLGLMRLRKESLSLALGWAAYLAGMLFFFFTYSVTDYGSFYYPLWALVWPAAALGAWALARQITHSRPGLSPQKLASLAFIPAALALMLNWPLCNKAGYRGAIEYAHSVLDVVEPGAMILTLGDNDIYPLWYAQIVEGRRPDVLVVGGNFLSSPWYDAFFTAEALQKWQLPIQKRGFMTYEQFYDLINNHVVAPNLERGPVYATFNDYMFMRDFRVEVVSDAMIDDTDPAMLDSFLPVPFLIRLHPQQPPAPQ